MNIPCDIDRPPLCFDGPIANLSSEDADFRRYLAFAYRSPGCVGMCWSNVSEFEAYLCAQAQVDECVPEPLRTIPNETVDCSVPCPDGGTFTYTLEAGRIMGETQAEANARAYALCCEQARLRMICCPDVKMVGCVGEQCDFWVVPTGVTGDSITWTSVDGGLPPGMSLGFSGINLGFGGTPTSSGLFSITVRGMTSLGTYTEKTYSICILEILDTSIPDFTVGVAYSHQMTAAGGTGQYVWSIVSGGLPTGLSMSEGGLISGTPTSSATLPFTVRIVDLGCEASDASPRPAQVSMTTTSRTVIATWRGWREYIPSSPPKSYKTLTYTGYSKTGYSDANTGDPLGGAKYEYSGSSTIDLGGSYLDKYKKLFKTACQDHNTGPYSTYLGASLRGICATWVTPVGTIDSCGLCPHPDAYWTDSDWKTWGNYATNTAFETSDLAYGGTIEAIDATHAGMHRAGTHVLSTTSIVGVTMVRVTYDHNIDAVLSDEYTDADAMAQAQVINGHSTVAQNMPRGDGYVGAWTTVDYTLHFTDLTSGEDYQATVDLVSDTGVTTRLSFSFNASSDTHVISGSIPTPAAGHYTEIRNPIVIYA